MARNAKTKDEMAREDPDHDLRELFTAARRAEAARTPPFARLWAAARGRRRARPAAVPWLPLAATAAAVAAAVALALLVPDGGVAPEPDIDLAAVQWTAPTDFLLEVPGDELLTTLPSLGDAEASLWPPPAEELD